MMVVSVIPAFGITGRLQLSVPAAVLVFLMGAVMLGFAFKLYSNRDNTSARKLMLASVSYITLMQIVYVIDKFLS
jgi:protoheme IX farnesyltransferase